MYVTCTQLLLHTPGQHGHMHMHDNMSEHAAGQLYAEIELTLTLELLVIGRSRMWYGRDCIYMADVVIYSIQKRRRRAIDIDKDGYWNHAHRRRSILLALDDDSRV